MNSVVASGPCVLDGLIDGEHVLGYMEEVLRPPVNSPLQEHGQPGL